MKQRGSDLTIFSPRASFMAHHIGDFEVSQHLGGDLQRALLSRRRSCSPTTSSRRRCCRRSPGVDPETCIPELVKCVEQYGNVGINLNPDPSGGHWTSRRR